MGHKDGNTNKGGGTPQKGKGNAKGHGKQTNRPQKSAGQNSGQGAGRDGSK